MNNGRKLLRIPEKIKNVMIIVLAISAVFLGAKSGMYSQLLNSSQFISSLSDDISRIFSGNQQTHEMSSKSYSQASRPFAVVSHISGDQIYAAMWDSEELEYQYNSFSAALGEALGSASESAEIAEQSYRALLENNSCVYFDFYYPQSLSLLALWLGTNMVSDHTSSGILLAESSDGSSVLCYMDDIGGRFYCCETELSWNSVNSKLAEHGSYPVKFAYMLGYDISGLNPYAIISENAPSKNSYTVKNPFRINLSASTVLPLFSMNDYLASAYQESDGTIVYVESDSTLRISTGGRVVYRTSGNLTSQDEVSISEQLEQAYTLVEACLNLCGSDLGACLTSVQDSDDGSIFTFCYVIDGIPVISEDESYTAQVQVSSSGINRANITFHSYENTGETIALLPSSLQAAVVQSNGGGDMYLTYCDNGLTASPQWSTD